MNPAATPSMVVTRVLLIADDATAAANVSAMLRGFATPFEVTELASAAEGLARVNVGGIINDELLAGSILGVGNFAK